MKAFIPHVLCLGLFAVGFTPTLSATTLAVNWGGQYVDNYAAFTRSPTSAGGATTYAFSDTVAFNPGGPTFYGGVSLINGSGTGTPAFNSGTFGLNPGSGSTNDNIRFAATSTSGTLTMYGMIFFKKEDFINGAANQLITLDNESSIAFNVTSSSAGTGQIRRNRAAVYALKDGVWNWYLTNQSQAGTTNQTFDALATKTWAVYDPENTPFSAPPAAGDFTILGSEFEAIEAVGLFFHYATASEGPNISFYFNSFQAQVNAIPEPSTVMLLGGVCLLAGLSRFRPRL